MHLLCGKTSDLSFMHDYPSGRTAHYGRTAAILAECPARRIEPSRAVPLPRCGSLAAEALGLPARIYCLRSWSGASASAIILVRVSLTRSSETRAVRVSQWWRWSSSQTFSLRELIG